MPADPNWLYATIAQASATIVAIVGGLITATLLQLTAGRNSLTARLAEAARESETLGKQLTDAELAPERRRTEWVLGQPSLPLIELVDRGVDAPDAQRQLKATGINADVFAAGWRRVAARITDELTRIRAEVELHGFGERGDIDDWAQANAIDLSGRDHQLAQFVYWYCDARAHPPPPRSARPSGYLGGVSLLSRADEDRMAVERDRRDDELSNLRSVAAELRRKFEASDGVCEVLREELRHFRYPSHLTKGLAVLAVFSITGILIPLFLMPQPPELFTLGHRILAVGGFMVGLLLVFAYIVVVAREIQSGPDLANSKAPLPRPSWRLPVVGLLRRRTRRP